jgi:two-component system, OmpR family, sensor histidine kinase VicK
LLDAIIVISHLGDSFNEETSELLYGTENAVQRGVQFLQNVKKGMDLFGNKNGPSIIMEFEVYKNNYVDVKRRGGRIRLITEITKDNIHYCKGLMKIVDELRHLDGLIGGIAVSESEYMATTQLQKGKLLTQVFYSNAGEVVKQGQYIFNTFWDKAIPAKQRIREINEGLKREFIETIQDPVESRNLLPRVLSYATEEILIMIPTVSAFLLLEREGILGILKGGQEIPKLQHGIKIRILIGEEDRRIKDIMKRFRKGENKIDIRYTTRPLQTKLIVFVVDTSYSLVIEIKDDSQYAFAQSIGLTTYSNSGSTIISYAAIFETLYLQSKPKPQRKS